MTQGMGMEQGLRRWALAKGAVARGGAARRGGIPPLWLFTDAHRLADPLAAIAALPRGMAGVVYRPEGLEPAARLALGLAIARLCRGRRLALTVAGDGRLAALLGAGGHWREGRRPDLIGAWAGRRLRTGSAHGPAGLVRAHRAGVAIIFVSPAFPTRSHPGAQALGAVRFAGLAGKAGGAGRMAVAALGGIEGRSVRRLGRRVMAAGAIGALA